MSFPARTIINRFSPLKTFDDLSIILKSGNINQFCFCLGRGMNAAFAIAYLCEDEDQMHKISYMKESLDLVGLEF